MSTNPLPRRSNLSALTGPDAFWWATGIEDTFITAPHPVTGRTLDEYELTGHYARWRDDLGLMSSLGISAARYGVPWHRIQPERNRWEWQHADEPLERLLELGIAPQVDLVHYGLPGWIEGAFLDPDYPSHVAEYAARLAERFRGRIHWYTPLNEPRITAWYCGRLGWWPPHERSWNGFLRVLTAVAAGIQSTVAALRSVDSDIVAYHVDATDLYEASDPSLDGEAEHRRNIVFLGLDLVAGRVGEGHPLHGWLRAHLDDDAQLDKAAARRPSRRTSSASTFTRCSPASGCCATGGASCASRMPYTEEGLVEAVARAYHAALRRTHDAVGDRDGRQCGAAAALARALGRGGADPARGGRAGHRLHLVADVRARFLGMAARPQAGRQPSRPDGPVGS